MDIPGAKDGLVYVQLPNIVAPQMGFYQSVPKSYSSAPDEHMTNACIPNLEGFKTFCDGNKARKAA